MLVGGRPQVLWEGLAGLRGDAPSEARGADGERAGRRPRAHQAARPTRQATRRPEHQRHHKQQNSNARAPEGPTMAPERPENLAAVPVGGGGAWPGFETTRRAEGSRRGRRAGGPPPTGAPSSPAHETGHAAPGTPAAPQATKQQGKGARGTYHGAGESGEPGRGAGRRRQGLAGLRDDAPSRRLAARTASGRAAAHGRTKQSGSNTRKPRPADAGRGSPTQSGGRV